ncbi:MAG: AMP-binding protein [Desulfobacterales bacterium]
MKNRHLYTTVKESAECYPDKTAISYNGVHISYSELLRRIECAAAWFQKIGLNKGDRIGILMHNCPEFIVCFYAAMKLGLISVSINVMFTKSEVNYILKDAGIKVLLANRTYLDSVLYDGAPLNLTSQFYALSYERNSFAAILSFEKICLDDIPPLDINVHSEDIAVIAYTSGTTGFPKGAVHSHENIVRHLSGIRDYLGFNSEDVFLAALPFFQLVAYLIHVGLSLLVGGKLVILEKFDIRVFLKNLEKEKATFFAGVPTIYQMIYDSGSASDLSSVRFGICAGSPLGPSLRSRFEEVYNFRIIHCYGLTEISLIAACENPKTPAVGTSVGKPLPYIRLRLTKDGEKEIDSEEVGAIEIGTERAMMYYWNNPSETQAAIRNGWLDTGDMGYIDGAGNLHIIDRKKDMIIRGGFNVYPAELERILLEDSRVVETAIIGIPHDRLGEIPKAFVVLKNEAADDKEDIRQEANRKLAKYKAIETIEVVEPSFFPRNALGKILKRHLKKNGGKKL